MPLLVGLMQTIMSDILERKYNDDNNNSKKIWNHLKKILIIINIINTNIE